MCWVYFSVDMNPSNPRPYASDPASARVLLESLYRRRAIRDYTEAVVAASTIEELLAAAVQAPSSLNQQPWSFAIFQGKARLGDYSVRAKAHYLASELPPLGQHERGDTLTDESYSIFYNAGTLVVICAREGGLHGAEDCCLAAENFMLAAHAIGLGTCPIGIARPWLNLPHIKAELGIPAHHTVVFPMALGYPAFQPPPVPRKAPEVVVWLLPPAMPDSRCL